MTDDKCHECRTGKPPEKQANVPIDEIEEDMRRMRSPSGMDEFTKWYDERPLLVRESIKNFPPWQLYIVRDGAPYKYTCGGSIVSSLKWTENEKTGRVVPWFRVLRSPIGQAGVVAEIDPDYLEPITLDDLKEKVAKREEVIQDWAEDDSLSRISAGELRAHGLEVPESIPDCASVERDAILQEVTGMHVEEDQLVIEGKVTFAKPLEWIKFTFNVPEGVDADELVRELNEEIEGEVPVYGAPIFKED